MALKRECADELPAEPDASTVYHLIPRNPDPNYYRQRTDRNIGWLTDREQADHIGPAVVGIAGCGGMGGDLGKKLVCLGVKKIKIADNDVFDATNVHRQAAATRWNIGKSKALETANMIRSVTDDCFVDVYPQGICEETVDEFLAGCDIVCDEVEFFAPERILLHQRARALGVTLMNCNSVEAGTHLFLFKPVGSPDIAEVLGHTYPEMARIRSVLKSSEVSPDERQKVLDDLIGALLRGLVPEFPSFSPWIRERVMGRLRIGKAPIMATNPTYAAGYLLNNILAYLVRNSGEDHGWKLPPDYGYVYNNALRREFKTFTGRWW